MGTRVCEIGKIPHFLSLKVFETFPKVRFVGTLKETFFQLGGEGGEVAQADCKVSLLVNSFLTLRELRRLCGR